MRKNGKENECIKCGQKYYVRRERILTSRFCGKCWDKRNPPQKVKCKNCNNKFLKYSSSTKGKIFCSTICRQLWNKINIIGENAPAFKDGKSLERDRARQNIKVQEWRKSVFERDKFICRHCGIKKELQAHHIIEWTKDESKRFDIENGLTLCIDCHGKIHNRDFTKRLNKFCIDCGKKVKLPNGICHKCSAKRQWMKRKNTAKL